LQLLNPRSPLKWCTKAAQIFKSWR
jgi:hypothetical protein